MLTKFSVPHLEDISHDCIWLQQDGATCYTAREIFTVLDDCSSGRDVWLPCNSTPWLLDMELSKDTVLYQQAREHRNIEAPIFVKRVRMCQQRCGGHLKDILFHT